MVATIALKDGFKFQVSDEDVEFVLAHHWRHSAKWKDSKHYVYQPDKTFGLENALHFQVFQRMGLITEQHRTHRTNGVLQGPQLLIDHKNRDSRINTRENLRSATPAQNQANVCRRPGKSGVVGVRKQTGEYWYKINCGLETLSNGPYATAEEAGRKYRELLIRIHGEFACTVKWPEVFPELPDADYIIH